MYVNLNNVDKFTYYGYASRRSKIGISTVKNKNKKKNYFESSMHIYLSIFILFWIKNIST